MTSIVDRDLLAHMCFSTPDITKAYLHCKTYLSLSIALRASCSSYVDRELIIMEVVAKRLRDMSALTWYQYSADLLTMLYAMLMLTFCALSKLKTLAQVDISPENIDYASTSEPCSTYRTPCCATLIPGTTAFLCAT